MTAVEEDTAVAELLARRTTLIDTIAAAYPLDDPTATRLALRASRLGELNAVEKSLRAAGVSLEGKRKPTPTTAPRSGAPAGLCPVDGAAPA